MSNTQSTIINGSEENPWKSQLKGKYRTRVLAVQCLYSLDIQSKSRTQLKSSEKAEITAGILQYGQQIFPPDEIDNQYFLALIEGVFGNSSLIERQIEAYLSENWSLHRIAKVVQAILKLATYEILFQSSEAKAYLINEYLEIAKFLNHRGEVGFINSVLDKVSNPLTLKDEQT